MRKYLFNPFLIISFFLFCLPTLSNAQASAGATGGTSVGATDPFGTTVNDSITLNTKANNAAKSEVSAGASASWVFGCIEPANPPSPCQQGKNSGRNTSLGNQNIEIQTQASANYDDTWKAVPSSSTVVQQYSGAFNFLWNDGRAGDEKNWGGSKSRPDVWFQKLVHAPGSIVSLSEAHDNSQGIVSNTKLGAGIYWRPKGTLQDSKTTYLLVSGQAQMIKTEIYGNSFSPSAFGFYETIKFRVGFGRPTDKNPDAPHQFNLNENITIPTTSPGAKLQGVFDAKYSYSLTPNMAVTLEELDTYYGPGLVGGHIAQENASLATIGLTFKFSQPTIFVKKPTN